PVQRQVVVLNSRSATLLKGGHAQLGSGLPDILDHGAGPESGILLDGILRVLAREQVQQHARQVALLLLLLVLGGEMLRAEEILVLAWLEDVFFAVEQNKIDADVQR